MNRMTGKQLKQKFEEDPETISRILASSLRDFGYPISDQEVRTEIDKVLKGEKPTGGPGIFLSGWFREGVQ